MIFFFNCIDSLWHQASYSLVKWILWVFFFPLGKGSRPVIVSPPASITVIEGGDVTLSCNATGLPLPVIRWYDSRGLITSHPSQVLRSKPQKPPQATPGSAVGEPTASSSLSQAGWSSLRIRNVTPERGGEYTCEAINRHGSAVSKAFLTVGKLDAQNRRVGSLILGEKCLKIRN